MNGLLLRVRRSVRGILRPIQSRSVMLCKVHILKSFQYIVISLLICLLWPRRELRDKFVVSQYFHDVRREIDLSLSRSLESTMHQIDPCSSSAFCL